MSDEQAPLIGGEVRITTTQQVPQEGQQHHHPEEERHKAYAAAISQSQMGFGIHLIWMICFFAVFSSTDATTCTGPLYTFGSAARWFLLVFVIWDAFTYLVLRWRRAHPDPAYDTLPGWYTCTAGILGATALGFWIYSIVALAERDGCTGQSLTTLVWIWVILYAILPCVVCCCMCCCGAALFGGMALASRPKV